MNFFERVERDIKILFEHYYDLEKIIAILSITIIILLVIVIVNAQSINRLEKQIEIIKKSQHYDE